MTLLLVILFISGYILIALEHQTGISKSAIALLLGILLWTFIPHTDNEIINHLGDTAEILFYLLGAMTIVEWIDTHNGFTLITNHITTRNKRKLLWIIALITFIMSSPPKRSIFPERPEQLPYKSRFPKGSHILFHPGPDHNIFLFFYC